MSILSKAWPYIAAAAIVVALLWGAYHKGYQAAHDADLAASQAAILAAVAKAQAQQAAADAITQDVAVKAAEAQVKIVTVTQNLIEKVPVYVTKKSDDRCTIPRGFVRMHDAAASGIDLSGISLAAGESDDDPSGTALSAVAATVASNYGLALGTRQQLIDLQGWVRSQQALAAKQAAVSK